MSNENKIDSLIGVITIDPGVHTSMAFWKKDAPQPYREISFDVEKAARKFRPEHHPASNIAKMVIDNIATEFKPRAVFVEGVAIYGGSTRSMASATSGDLCKLSYMVGAIVYALELCGHKTTIIQPSEWKGQFNDEALRLRIQRAGLEKPKNPHIAAAIGMGLSLRGWL